VISAGRSFWDNPSTWATWQAMQANDTTLSSMSNRVVAEKAQHEVEHDQPDVIVTQVERMIQGFH
jgi:hypothetical protein